MKNSPTSYENRRRKLLKLREALKKFEAQILAATRQDFSKPEIETQLTELLLVQHELSTALKNLRDWMAPQVVPSGLLLFGARSEIHPQPKGRTLIISPWNYPWQLSLSPLVASLAAGNQIVLKPSELTPACSQVLQEMIQSSFAKEEVEIVLGGVEVSQKLLSQKWDHIFFTGSGEVGKIVMEAASRQLTSVTLELGGKSPVLVDSTADLNWAAQRIAWGKWVNAGQSCVAPDTLFVEKAVWPELKKRILSAWDNFSTDSDSSAALVTPRHWQRLCHLVETSKDENTQILQSAKPALDSVRRTFPLTLIEKTKSQNLKTPVESEEIFGPLLLVYCVDRISEALEELKMDPKPLAFYFFSQNPQNQNLVLNESRSGGLVINDILVHLANPELPFGGSGSSGHGAYHGYHGFREFSHFRSTLIQGRWTFLARYFQPPYTSKKQTWARRLVRFFSS